MSTTEATTHTDQAREYLSDAADETHLYAADPRTRDYRAEALRDAAVGIGHAVLALQQGLADISAGLHRVADPRPDVMGITRAVRDLTDALPTTVQPADLVDVSNSVADVRSEVAEVAAAVRELAEAIRDQQQPRRRWFSRRKEK
ncbi:hypothetical protein [Streptosporangium canum]|uniref:hypothetical protein n=1 Tax=Streptosporangium canum TaxID=324952 RepID=UPI00378B5FD6